MTTPPVQRFLNLMKLYRSELRQIYVYALFVGVVNLTLPLGIQAIINFLQIGELTSTWVLLVIFVLVGIAITGILQVLQLRVVENIQQDLFARSGFEFAYRIPKITFLQLDRIHAPELVNRFFDTLTVQKGLPKILIDFSLAIFQIVFGLILLAIYSPFFIILGVTLAFILYLIFRVTGPKGLETSLIESKYKYRLAHWLEEVARVNRTFKMNSGADFHLEKTDSIVSGYLKSRESHFRVLINQFRFFVGFKVILAAGLLLLGGVLVFNEQLNLGQFVASEIVILLIINSVEKIIRTIDTIYDTLTGLEKIGYVTDLELDKHGGQLEVRGENGFSVRVRDLDFTFPGMRRNIIENLSFELAENEKVVLGGPSGSGKSVLLQILAGIHRPNEGEVYVNGIPFNNYRRGDLTEHLAVSFPTNQIFEGTFRENILLGRDHISEDRLEQCLDILDLTEYVIHQPQGLDTDLDSGGRRLPRSIIQKILVARIIVANPQLLLLEDPLQFLADDEKKRIIDYLMSPERKWTLLVISDFHYWQERADRILTIGKPR